MSWTRSEAQVLVEQLELAPSVEDGVAAAALLVAKPLSRHGALRLLRRERMGNPREHVGQKCRAPAPVPEPGIPVDWDVPIPSSDPTEVFGRVDEAPIVLPPLSLDRRELERTLYVPDTHRPFHDRRAWALLLSAARDFRPHTVVFLGDYFDCYVVSDHDRDPRRGTQLKAELDEGEEGIEEVAALGAQRVVYCKGNHEYRLDRFLMRNAPALLDLVDVDSALGIADRGWTVVPYYRHVRIGKVYATHDAGHAGIHAAHATGQAFGHSVAFGHTHQLVLRYFGSVDGERHVAANFGWLGNVWDAQYAPESRKRFWQLGFGTSVSDADGNFFLHAHPIVGRRCEVRGKVYEV